MLFVTRKSVTRGQIFPELEEPAASYLLFTLFIVQWGMFG